MVAAKAPDHTWEVGRLGRAAAWISAIGAVPYLVLKLLWTFDVPLGIADRSVLDSGDWVAANALMAMVELVGLLLVLCLTRPWARRVPTWLLLFPVWVGTGLLFQVVLGAALAGASAASSSGSVDTGEIQPWVYLVVYPSFAVQGAALAIAFSSHVRARWGGMLTERSGAVISRRTVRARSWAQRHLTQLAEAAAGMAVAMARVCGYWAAGGSLGPSRMLSDVPWEMHASRAFGAVIAAVGLLGLAGGWGQRTSFWVPTALTWVGSGAVAAFDGLALFASVLLGADASAPAWSPTDTLLVVKVMTGLVAGVLVALAFKSPTALHEDTRTAHDEKQCPTLMPNGSGGAQHGCHEHAPARRRAVGGGARR
jgi:hypothetical protein